MTGSGHLSNRLSGVKPIVAHEACPTKWIHHLLPFSHHQPNPLDFPDRYLVNCFKSLQLKRNAMKKIVSAIVLAVLVLPMLALAQNATNANSGLRTGVWEGKWTWNGVGESTLKLNVESVAEKHIKAQANFVDRDNTIIEVNGDIVDSFGDFVEQSHWQFAIKDKKFKDGTWIKMTETKLIQGRWDLKGTYYLFLSGDSIVGCWYYNNETHPSGRIELKAPESSN
jgi:hypothetical protein